MVWLGCLSVPSLHAILAIKKAMRMPGVKVYEVCGTVARYRDGKSQIHDSKKNFKHRKRFALKTKRYASEHVYNRGKFYFSA